MRTLKHAPLAAEDGHAAISIYAIFASCLAICIALFLHPMSPMDFLALACSDPFATLVEQGAPMAALFWCGLILSLSAVFVLLRSMNLPRIHFRPIH